MHKIHILTKAQILLIIPAWILAGCSIFSQQISTSTPTMTPTSSPTPSSTPLPATEHVFNSTDSGWEFFQPGLENRRIDIFDEQGKLAEAVIMVRLDQNRFRLDIAYSVTPKNLGVWQAETNAVIAVNGGYFSIEGDKYIPEGLTIIGGRALGSSYESFGGMVAISSDHTELRWLADKPYDPKESLAAALQSFPVLVKPGGVLGFPAQHEDNIRARRTVIGQDKEGNLLFFVTPMGYFTLHQLSAFLADSDLNLDIAINLDGGPSSGMVVKNDPHASVSAQSPLPVVVLVRPQ